MRKFEYKVPGGKLLRAKAEVVDGKISFLQISGDFFLLPETDLEDIEVKLLGVETNADTIKALVVSFFTERETMIAGAKPEDFAHVIISAIES